MTTPSPYIACARDALLLKAKHLPEGYTIAEHGFPPPIPTPGITMTNPSPPSYIPAIKVITVKPHGSIMKAAAVTGIGRMNVIDLPAAALPSPGASADPGGHENPWGLKFDLQGLESQLREAKQWGQGVIVVVTLGEVNTVSVLSLTASFYHRGRGKRMKETDTVYLGLVFGRWRFTGRFHA